MVSEKMQRYLNAQIQNQMNERGFTLIEIMVVVAIIGILSSLAVPSLQKMVERSREAESRTNLSGIYQVESLVKSEFGAYTANLYEFGYSPDGGTIVNGRYVFDGYYSHGFDDLGCTSGAYNTPSQQARLAYNECSSSGGAVATKPNKRNNYRASKVSGYVPTDSDYTSSFSGATVSFDDFNAVSFCLISKNDFSIVPSVYADETESYFIKKMSLNDKKEFRVTETKRTKENNRHEK